MTAPHRMRYEFFALSDVGRVRENNEDAVAIHAAQQLALLADGMGGYNAGEVAAQMAVQLVGEGLCNWLDAADDDVQVADIEHAMDVCVLEAHQEIAQAARANRKYAGMGTTLVTALFHGTHLVLAHIGDSRCYRLRAGHLQLITRDHTWLQEQIDAGVFTVEEAASTGLRNLLTRALGVDVALPPEIQTHAVVPGDLYLLCSDGLTDMLDDEALQTLLHPPQTLADCAAQLIAQANAQGGRDNVSVLLVQARADTAAQASA